MSSVSGVSPLDNNPEAAEAQLEKSKLYRTLHQPPAVKPAAGNTVQFSLRDIANFLYKVYPYGVTYDQLMTMSIALLTPQDKSIYLFLQHNRLVFDRLAILSGDQNTISPENLKAITTVSGDFVVLSNGEIRYLQKGHSISELELPSEPKNAVKSQAKPSPQTEARQREERLTALLNKINPKGLTFQELQQFHVPPGHDDHFSQEEHRMLHILQSSAFEQPIAEMLQHHDGQLTPEVIRVLSGLIWNPMAFWSNVPVVFYTPPPPVEELHPMHHLNPLPATNPDHDVFTTTTVRLPEATQEIQLSAVKLHTILHKISPDGRATLKQLQQYKPSNPEEMKTLNALRNQKVFKILANLDGRQNTLDDDDIEIMASKKSIYLSDAHLLLVIHE